MNALLVHLHLFPFPIYEDTLNLPFILYLPNFLPFESRIELHSQVLAHHFLLTVNHFLLLLIPAIIKLN